MTYIYMGGQDVTQENGICSHCIPTGINGVTTNKTSVRIFVAVDNMKNYALGSRVLLEKLRKVTTLILCLLFSISTNSNIQIIKETHYDRENCPYFMVIFTLCLYLDALCN